MLTALGVVFAISVLIGVPIAMGLGLAAVGGILAWGKVPLYLIPQRMFTGVDSFVLMAIPFFMLAGELMDATGILDRMLKFADALVGRIRGGIAHVNVVAGMILSGVSGSAVADASAIGSALLPVMKKEYSIDFGAGVVSGATGAAPFQTTSLTSGPSYTTVGAALTVVGGTIDEAEAAASATVFCTTRMRWLSQLCPSHSRGSSRNPVSPKAIWRIAANGIWRTSPSFSTRSICAMPENAA